jgi:hypothetical protein
VTGIAIANNTSPIPIIAGITSGRFTSLVTTSRMTPKTRAGIQRGQRVGTEQVVDRAHVRLDARGDADAALREEPSRAREEAAHHRVRHEPNQVAEPEHPSNENVMPVNNVMIMVAATTVKNARLRLPTASRAVVVATTASTAAAASCTLTTTPRVPALQARIASVNAAATR